MYDLEKLKNPDIQYWPEIRWWLAEGLHTDETLKKEVADLHDAGFGAIEFLAMDEPGADSRLYGWGSEEWVHDSHVLTEETTTRNMGVSMTSGTNWSNTNLTTISPDDKAAAKELDFAAEIIRAGEKKDGPVKKAELKMPGVTKQELEAVTAIRILDEKAGETLLDKESAVVLTDCVREDRLDWTAPKDGDYLLFYFWMHGTGQTAEPSVSTSYTVNYLDRYGAEAFAEYWDDAVLTDELKKHIEKNGRAMLYMDSLELGTFGRGGQLWGYHLREEFETRRGYDLTPYLPFILKEPGMMQPVYHYYYSSGDKMFTEKLLNDLYQTMTDLYMENMLKPMQEWLHTHHMALRSEISYGLPFEISQPGKYVDGIETESFEFASQIESHRNLAGPAHIYNRTFSSETGATMLNYMMGLDFYTQIIFTQFAAGVIKTVLHGYSSIRGSEESTYWPGHEGMWPVFSERFGSRQPSSIHYKEWTAMIARYQMLLRQGRPRMDLGIVRLDYNFNNLIFDGDEKKIYESQLMRGNEGIYWKDMQLQNSGYTWDYFAPQILEEDFVDFAEGVLLPDGPGYQALILYQEMLPVKSAEKILELAKKGLPVLFVNGVTETVRPAGGTKTYKQAASMTPFHDGADERLEEIVKEIKALPNTKEVDDQSDTYETLQKSGIFPRAGSTENNRHILTHMKEDENNIYVFVYNMQYTEEMPFSFSMKIRGTGRIYRTDCWTAEIEEMGNYRTEHGCSILDITLAPGGACMYVLKKNEESRIHAVQTNVDKLIRTEHGFRAIVTRSGKYEILFSDGSIKELSVCVPEDIELPVWNLEVEDWNEGEKREIVEDRGLGIVTKEVYYETKKERISAGKVGLKPWKDLEAVGPEVSGVGYYTAKAVIPEGWKPENGAVLKIGSINKHTAAVYVNDIKAKAVDFDALEADISDLLKAGENVIRIEVTSSLNNRLLARGYFEKSQIYSMELAENANIVSSGTEDDGDNVPPDMSGFFQIQDYGMVNGVRLVTYTAVEIETEP